MKVLPSLAIALLVICVSLALSGAADAALISDETKTRGVMVAIGLMVAVYGNLIPKQLPRTIASPRMEAVAQALRRTAGWSMTLGGLAFAAFWIFAPVDVAEIGSVVALGAASLFVAARVAMAVNACGRGGATAGG